MLSCRVACVLMNNSPKQMIMKKMIEVFFERWNRSNVFAFFLLCTSMVAFTACDDDDDDAPAAPTSNIVALAQENSSLTMLVDALTRYPDLVSALSSPNDDYTVFAPTNDAFEDMLDAIGQESIDDIPEDVLRNVLEYHVLAGSAVKSTELTAGDIEMLNDEAVTVAVSNGVKLNGTVNVT